MKKRKAKATDGHIAHFDLDVSQAIADQLRALIDKMVPVPLQKVHGTVKGDFPKQPGVYCLFHKDEIAYVGKSDNLQNRIDRHADEVVGRKNLSGKLGVIAITMPPNWTPFSVEKTLMEQLRAKWNQSGFGSNDLGRERDTQVWKSTSFDVQYPIDSEVMCKTLLPGKYPAAQVMKLAKRELAKESGILLRYATKKLEALKTQITISKPSLNLRELLELVVDACPGWHAALLPGYAVMYDDIVNYKWPTKVYQHGTKTWSLRTEGRRGAK